MSDWQTAAPHLRFHPAPPANEPPTRRSTLTLPLNGAGDPATSRAEPPAAKGNPRRAFGPNRQAAEPTLSPTDPRWVLAVRTAQVLQGSVLPAAQRNELLRVGRLLGLNAFEANLVIAIVQDQARRGRSPSEAVATLQMVPRTAVGRRRRRMLWRVIGLSAAVLAAEAAALLMWL